MFDDSLEKARGRLVATSVQPLIATTVPLADAPA